MSRWAWVLLAGAALVDGGIWIVTHRLRPVQWTGDAELVALAAERERLRDHDDALRDTLRRQHRSRIQQAWTAARLAAVPAQLGTDWRCEWAKATATERWLVLTRATVPLREWPACLAVAHEWSGKPGVRLDSLEVVANGSARQRKFTRIAMTLRFIMADAATGTGERAFPSPGALPVAPAEEAANSRNVGPVPSLRVPSASAEPPASGPAFAPVRPDPPGFRAAIENQIQRS